MRASGVSFFVTCSVKVPAKTVCYGGQSTVRALVRDLTISERSTLLAGLAILQDFRRSYRPSACVTLFIAKPADPLVLLITTRYEMLHHKLLHSSYSSERQSY